VALELAKVVAEVEKLSQLDLDPEENTDRRVINYMLEDIVVTAEFEAEVIADAEESKFILSRVQAAIDKKSTNEK
jgi:hypothetical protein